jgi:hypothetical protein
MKKLTVCMFLALAPHVLTAATGYLVHNLVADAASTASPAADFIDPRLVNAWGIAASATSPFWVCDGGTGLSTVYTVNDTNSTALGTPNATTQPTVPGAGGTRQWGLHGDCLQHGASDHASDLPGDRTRKGRGGGEFHLCDAGRCTLRLGQRGLRHAGVRREG